MNKIFLVFLMTLLYIGNVNAISILGAGEVDFQSNNNLYDGPAFVISGVENGGRDIISWEIDDLDQRLDDGYDLTKTGTIISDFKSEGFEYALQNRQDSWTGRIIGTANKWSSSSASEWCSDLGGDFISSKSVVWNYACIEFYPDYYYFSLQPGVYRYEVDYTLSVSGEGSDTFTLDETTPRGGRLIGDRNWFQAVRQTNGVPPRSDPDINDRIWVVYDLNSARWNTVSPNSQSTIDYNDFVNYYIDCTGGVQLFGSEFSIDWPGVDRTQSCLDNWNDIRQNKLNNNYVFEQNVNLNDIRYTGNGLGTGSVKFDDGNIYRNPIVTLTINADRIGVIRTFGIGEFVSVDYPSNMQVGESYPIEIVTTNVGDATMDASLSFSCSSFDISGITTRYSLEPGETLRDSGSIIFTGGVVGCGNEDCRLTIGNTNAVGDDDSFSFTTEVCQVSECQQEGSTDCFGDTIRECRNIGGVLKYQTVKDCPVDTCTDEGYNAFCDVPTDPVCGDNICQTSEEPGEEFACSQDCSIIEPICGDNICDTREKNADGFYYCPSDCDIDDGGDFNWLLFSIIGGAVLLVGGAIFLRLRLLGYFK